MKAKKEKLLTLMGLGALVIAAMATLLPVRSQAYVSGSKQYVATVCSPSGNLCNDCDSGSKDCSDHTCAQCAPQME